MEKITKKELKKLAKDYYKIEPIIQEIPDALNREIVKEALLKMFEAGYRYGEASNNK
jgi:hypothetical protein